MTYGGSWITNRETLSKLDGACPIIPTRRVKGPWEMRRHAVGEGVNQSHVLFDRFVQATTCKGTLKAFQELCDFLELKPNEYRCVLPQTQVQAQLLESKSFSGPS